MQKDKAYFLLFHTIHDVFMAEKLLKRHDIPIDIVPVPRNLSSDCGSCIRLSHSIKDVLPYIKDIELVGCFYFDGNNYKALEI